MDRNRRALHTAFVCGFLLVSLLWGGYLAIGQIEGVDRGFQHIEDSTADWRCTLFGARPVPRGVVIVAIDDETVRAAGRYPLPRDLLAKVVRALAAAGPQAIAVDLLFLDAGDPQADADLADALRGARSVVGAVGLFDAKRAEGGAVFSSIADRILWPTRPIADAASVGLVNVGTDHSGMVRHIPMVFQTKDRILQSFVMAASATALGVEPVIGDGIIKLAGRSTRTDLGYNMPIHYYGQSGSIRHFSAAQAIRGNFDANAVRGQVVLIGVTAIGSGDVFVTPFDRAVPGVEIMATAITNLLSGDGLARTGTVRIVDAATAIMLPVGTILLLALMRPLAGACLSVVLVLTWLCATVMAYYFGYWLSIAVPLGSLLPVAAGYGLIRVVLDRLLVQRLAGEAALLAKFQSPRLIDVIARDKGFLAKPVRQSVAVIFLDLSGFTGVAEELGPEWTRDLLAAFHTLIEREVSMRQGTIISFMGDGAMILFGLPAPKEDDADRALRTILGLDDAIAAWLRSLPPVARDRLALRIAGHLGPAVVSRLGSAQHQYVTATGDTVNVTSRLLEVAKERGERVIISDELKSVAPASVEQAGRCAAVRATEVAIRGRAASLRVHAWH